MKKNKEVRIFFRTTIEEKKLIFKKADKLGLTVSEFLLKRARDVNPIALEDKKAFFAFESRLNFLGNMGNNLNQLTESIHLIRKGYLFPGNEIETLLELLKRNEKTLREFKEEIHLLAKIIFER